MKLHTGDLLDVLPTLPADSVDAVVTDPPYGLRFMGRRWDYDVPSVAKWREVLRVLKPGGHLLSFGGSRTYHRVVVNIEDAGFEIRDCIMWLYGSGFPKSLDVGKAIDKRRVEDEAPVRNVCRYLRAAMGARGIKSRDLVDAFGGCHARLIDHWAARDTDSQPSLPTLEQWRKLTAVLSLDGSMDAEVERLNARKGEHSDTWRSAKVIGEYDGVPGGFGDHRFAVRDAKIREASIDAQEWHGWGTALKPAHEPIVLARKPLIGTVAANVQEHGTGALNIDASRIMVGRETISTPQSNPCSRAGVVGRDMGISGADVDKFQAAQRESVQRTQTMGRWPANVIHDGSDEVVRLFPAEAGAAAPVHRRGGDKFMNSYGTFAGNVDEQGSTFHGDAGSAARFFYCAKASKSDRSENGEVENKHPTVKPTALMRYLCRLVTPAGGVVLDPFMGSGSTGKAAALEGFQFIGIDREAEYVQIAMRRIQFTRDQLRAASSQGALAL